MHEHPTIPETISIYLGIPESESELITVPFLDYVKNVASSEIYPTWPENAIRANVYTIATNALQRIFTRHYRSQGYEFDITNSPELDQSYTYGRATFENVDMIVDQLFTSYISRQGDNVPLFTENCNGTMQNCDGLSLWGTVDLANQGLTPFEILRTYDGSDLTIHADTPFAPLAGTSEFRPLTVGDSGNDVTEIQLRLNRISNNFPTIPKIYPTDGMYTGDMTNSVKEFQRIFDLDQTGAIDAATWATLQYLYARIRRISELNYEESAIADFDEPFPDEIFVGESNNFVRVLQYYLAVIAQNIPVIPDVNIDGLFGPSTEKSLRAFQRVYALPETGTFDAATQSALYNVYRGIVLSMPEYYSGIPVIPFPGYLITFGMQGSDVRLLQEYLNKLSTVYPDVPRVAVDGNYGTDTRNAVIAVQRHFELTPNGFVNESTWNAIASEYADLIYSEYANNGQFGGYELSE